VTDDGRYLVVATEFVPGSIVVFDLTNPRAPRRIARYSTAATRPGVHTAEVARVNGVLHGFLSIDPGGGNPARLIIVELSDPTSPRLVLDRFVGRPYVHDVFYRDGLLFLALWDDGLQIWDIGGGTLGGTPANPRVVGSVETFNGNAHNVWWFHDPATGSKRYAFVGEEGPSQLGVSSSGDIHVIDVSDMSRPREVAVYTVPGAGTHNFSMDEQRGILYAAYYNGGVRAIDVRGDLGSCSATQRFVRAETLCDLAKMGRELGGAVTGLPLSTYLWGVQYSGGAVYASDMLNGLWKLQGITR
jgi:hypothetical protein